MEKFLEKRAILGGFVFLCFLVWALLPLESQAARPLQKVTPPLAKSAQTEHFAQKTRYIRHGLDINDFRIPMTNYAIFGQFIELGAAGGEWPKGSNEFYIFGAGIWVGGTVNDSTLQTFAFSNSGSPRDEALWGSLTDHRVALGYNPSGGAEEFSGLTDIFITGHPEDYDDPDYWPLPEIVGIQDSYCEFDDQDLERWDTGSNSNAGDGQDIARYGLGVKVIQRTHSWNYENNKTIHFFIYDIINIREDRAPIRNCFLSVMCDADVGPTANDDLVGFDHGRNLGYCYDSDFAEQGFARIPGFLAYKFLESPVATYDVDLNGDDVINDDSVLINGVYIKDIKKGEPLGLTSFKTSNLQSGDPDTEPEKYIIMAGHNYPDVGDQRYAPFDLGTGTTPVDQRFFQNTGPFLLAAPGDTLVESVWAWDEGTQSLEWVDTVTVIGDTVRVVVAVMMAPDEASLHLSETNVADAAQAIYDANFTLPRPPDHPNVTVIPDDRKVFISWDATAELSADPYYKYTSDTASALYDPLYREFDFEGYKLYRSTSGLPGTYELLASWDKTSVTPRNVDIEQLSGPEFEGISYDEGTTEGWFLAVYGPDLFTGHEYLIQVKADGSFFVSNLTLGVDIPPSDVQEHWYEIGEPPYVFEVFSWGYNPYFDMDDLPVSRSTEPRVADGTYDDYFDGCWLLVGGMAIHFTGDAPSDEVVFRVTGHLEVAEGSNREVSHAYVDSGLINGVTYYYDVIAYDFQPFSSPRSLENGIIGQAVIPRSHATGLTQGSAYNVQHSSGSSDGSVEVLVIEPDSVTGHDYEVGFYEGDPPLPWYLKDLQTDSLVLDNMTNQTGNDDYPVVNGLVVKVAGPSPGISEWEYDPSANRWFTGVNWGGAYLGGGLDLGVNFFGSSATPADYVTIEMRFSATERQKAYDYLRGGDPNYGYVGYFEVPFTAWDVTADPPRQVNVAFVEANGQPEYDSTWGPSLSTGGREYLFILASDYADTPQDYYTTRQIYANADEFDVLYAAWFVAREDAEGNPRTWTEGDVFRLTPYFVNLVDDKFTFSTTAKLINENQVNLDDIKVVPNPYIVRNIWEPSRDYSRIAFTHLPDKCTIRVYTLSGDHLITLQHDSPELDGNENWDLLTKNQQKIAAGVYIFHVDSPYGEKIGKFAVVR